MEDFWEAREGVEGGGGLEGGGGMLGGGGCGGVVGWVVGRWMEDGRRKSFLPFFGMTCGFGFDVFVSRESLCCGWECQTMLEIGEQSWL